MNANHWIKAMAAAMACDQFARRDALLGEMPPAVRAQLTLDALVQDGEITLGDMPRLHRAAALFAAMRINEAAPDDERMRLVAREYAAVKPTARR